MLKHPQSPGTCFKDVLIYSIYDHQSAGWVIQPQAIADEQSWGTFVFDVETDE